MGYNLPPIPPAARGTTLDDLIHAVHAVYSEFGQAVDAFRLKSGIDCPPDCGGRCCEGFEPDVMDAEGLYLAAWIRLNAPALEQRVENPPRDEGCPFWDQGTGRCSCYHGRALVCRAFGFGAVRLSSGQLAFRLCFAMPDHFDPDGRSRRTWTGKDILDSLGAEPPLMADWGTRLVGLDPSGTRGPLGASVRAGLQKLRLLDRLSPSPTDDGNHPSVPPRAA